MNSSEESTGPAASHSTAELSAAALAKALGSSAIGSAVARAAHLIVDNEPRIFADTLVGQLLGELGEQGLGYHRAYSTAPILVGARTEATCRARFAEDILAASAASQVVVLGAGLDTTAYRLADRPALTVVEVDQPAAQRAKRALLAAAGIAEPPNVRYVAANFEADDLAALLWGVGLDPAAPTVVSWLGVTMYLSRSAIEATAAVIAQFAPGSKLVADYILAPDLRDDDGAAYAAAASAAIGGGGEPWLSTFTPDDLSELLRSAGFATVDHHRQRDTIHADLWERTDGLHPLGVSGLLVATV